MCLDVGDRRIGLAVSDQGEMLATPAGVIERTRLQRDLALVLEHLQEKQVGAIVVGLPLTLEGKIGPQAKKVKAFVKALRRETQLPIKTMDERFSSVEAEGLLRQAGRKPSRHKGEVDAAAAAVILQEYLDGLRARTSSKKVSQAGDAVI